MSSTVDFEVSGTVEALEMASKGRYLERYGIVGNIVFEIRTDLEAVLEIDDGMKITDTVFVKAYNAYFDHEARRYRKVGQ